MKNNSKLRTWDNAAYFRSGIIQLTKKSNPYKKNTLEADLLDFIISLNGMHLRAEHNLKLLSYLKKRKTFLHIDSWCLHQLLDRAVWLALNAGCIKFIRNNNNQKVNFGVYLQSGLLDLLHEPKYFNKLISNGPNKEKTEHLHKVAIICSMLKELWKLPILKQYKNTLEISNLDRWMLERSESIPIQNWSVSTPDYVEAKTRGIYHHLGDEMAFICSAIQYGDCYILGNDEFGDLMVLDIIKGKDSVPSFKLGDICDPLDFNYIYGVPVSNAMYPSWRNAYFNYCDEASDQCQSNDFSNSQFSNKYWKIPFFLTQSQRHIKEYTVKDFSLKLIDSIKSIMSEDDYVKYTDLFDYKLISKFYLLNKIYVNCYSSPLKFVECFLSLNTEDKISHYLKEKKIFITKKRLHSISEIIFEVSPHLNNILYLCDKYNDKLEKSFSYFYKTVAHKVHCDIINPKTIDESGFFLKDGKPLKLQKFNLYNVINQIFQPDLDTSVKNIINFFTLEKRLKNILGDKEHAMFQLHHNSLKHSIIKQTSKNDKIKDLINYWDDLNTPAFVVSNVVDMQNEYRIFIINHRPVASTACFRNTTPFNAWNKGRFDPRLCNGHSAFDYFLTPDSRSRVASYAKFARQFTKGLKQENPEFKNYVLDVAYSQDANNGKGGVIPIEINSITWSGAYQVDFRRVCAAIANKKYNFSDMNKLGDYEHLMHMAQDKLDIINQETNHEVDIFLNSLNDLNNSHDKPLEDYDNRAL